MRISPDEMIFWQYGFFQLNLTLVTTWALMAVLIIGSWLVTRNLKKNGPVSRWQATLEMIVLGINDQLKEVGLANPRKYLPFIGTLFLFIVISNVCIIIPWYEPPTGSLSTTTALALAVFLSVPFFSIRQRGVKGYLKSYIEPTFIMLPFNIIGEVSRTLALAVRLFGNIMSGGMVVAILLSIAPFIFPVLINVLGLLTGVVQAYIFAILATVYISSATNNESENS